MCKVFLDSGSNYNNCDNSKLNLPQIEEQKGSTLSETLYAKTEVEIYYYVVPEIEINNAVLKNVSVYLLGKDDWQKKMGKGSSFY